MRLIDADAFILEQLRRTRVSDTAWQEGYWLGVDDTIGDIGDTPTIEAEPVKHGRWERTTDGAAFCTACKRKMNPSQYGYAFCGLCGAKMDGAD